MSVVADGRWKILMWSLGIIFGIFLSAIGATNMKMSTLENSVNIKIEKQNVFNAQVIKQLSSIDTKLSFIINKKLK